MLTSDKHSSLFCQFINKYEKKVNNIGYRFVHF